MQVSFFLPVPGYMLRPNTLTTKKGTIPARKREDNHHDIPNELAKDNKKDDDSTIFKVYLPKFAMYECNNFIFVLLNIIIFFYIIEEPTSDIFMSCIPNGSSYTTSK